MAGTWLQIQVELLEGGEVVCDPPPGRVMLVGPMHTFSELAIGIDTAFARWDQSHLHTFELADGRVVGLVVEGDNELGWLDGTVARVMGELRPGDECIYTFDLGEGWKHRCRVLPELVDPLDFYETAPPRPFPVMGWGWIPDQYGAETPPELG